jgi:DNA-binding NtrC family response regulator
MRRALRCVVIGSDSSWIRSVERVLLNESPRVRTILFSDPLLALDFLLRDSADAVITDLFMPEVHGLLFVEAVRHFGLRMPVILVSNEPSIEAEALASGANAFLAGSELALELAPTLERLLSKTRRRHVGKSADLARPAPADVLIAAAR